MTPFVERLSHIDIVNFKGSLQYNTGWIGRGLEELAQEEKTVPIVERFVRIFESHPEWIASGQFFEPPTSVLELLETPRERIQFLVEGLEARERLFERIREHFGITTEKTQFALQLGNAKPLVMSMENTIYPGGTRFILLEPTSEPGNWERQLGIVDVNYFGSKLASINLVQDYGEAVILPTQPGQISMPTEDKNEARRVIRARQKAIREAMRPKGSSPEIPYAAESPGVEELLTAASMKILLDSHVLDPDAVICFPKATTTTWGKLGELGARKAFETAITRRGSLLPIKTADAIRSYITTILGVTSTLENVSAGEILDIALTSLVYQLRRKDERIENGETPMDMEPMIIEGKQIPLANFLIILLASDVTDSSKRQRAADILAWFITQPLTASTFEDTLYTLGQLTDSYAGQFHAYDSTFSNLPTQIRFAPDDWRIVLSEELRKKPYFEQVHIQPITAE